MMRFAKLKAVASIVTPVLILAASPAPLLAQKDYPNKPIRMLIPYGAGGGVDFVTRVITPKVTENWGQPVVIENRPSAGGVIASQTLVNAPPDGQTLMMQSSGHAMNASLFSKLPYDTIKDFAGVTLVADVPSVLIADPGLGLKTVKDLIELAKAKPGQLNYASSGIGSGTHMQGVQLMLQAGINVVHVPFKGVPEMNNAVITGTVHYSFSTITQVIPLIKAGRVAGLGVATKTRSPLLPDVPSIAESGLPGFEYNQWVALLAPAATPRSIKEKLGREIARILALPQVAERLLTQGATPHTTTPEQLDAFIKEEIVRLAKVVKASGAKAD